MEKVIKKGPLNILDTLKCIELAIKNPAKLGEFKVRNQFTEVFSIKELALLVQKASNEIGIKTKIEYLKNPRHELAKHYYNPKNNSFLKIGLKPILLNKTFIITVIKKIIEFKKRVDHSIIDPKVKWDQRL